MGDLNSGVLTLVAFGVLAVFAVVAYLSLRGHIRGIEAPTADELEEMEDQAPRSGTPDETPRG